MQQRNIYKTVPTIMWKIENVPNTLDDLTKTISGQRVRSAGFSPLTVTERRVIPE